MYHHPLLLNGECDSFQISSSLFVTYVDINVVGCNKDIIKQYQYKNIAVVVCYCNICETGDEDNIVVCNMEYD